MAAVTRIEFVTSHNDAPFLAISDPAKIRYLLRHSQLLREGLQPEHGILKIDFPISEFTQEYRDALSAILTGHGVKDVSPTNTNQQYTIGTNPRIYRPNDFKQVMDFLLLDRRGQDNFLRILSKTASKNTNQVLNRREFLNSLQDDIRERESARDEILRDINSLEQELTRYRKILRRANRGNEYAQNIVNSWGTNVNNNGMSGGTIPTLEDLEEQLADLESDLNDAEAELLAARENFEQHGQERYAEKYNISTYGMSNEEYKNFLKTGPNLNLGRLFGNAEVRKRKTRRGHKNRRQSRRRAY